jgi:hypothetical protein
MAATFDNYGVKVVTKTDQSKGAYVPNLEQRNAIQSAGILPAAARPAPNFKIAVLADPNGVTSVKASYYHSLRKTAAKKRAPEPRMGHELISSWLKAGDVVLIGNVGSALFAQKLASGSAAGTSAASAASAAAAAAATMAAAIVKKAKKAKGVPKRKTISRNDFIRNPYVVAAALMRANGKCEMPGCKCTLFTKDDGNVYLEGHHIVPLSEGGTDELSNAAGLCPHCHRLLHFGKDRDALRKTLAAHIATIVF